MSEIGNEGLAVEVETGFESPRLNEAKKLIEKYESIDIGKDDT